MLVGHLGAGLAAKAVQPKIGLGTLLAAAMLLDIVLWILVLTGVEAATVPPDYQAHHYLYFNFPYSHSLLAAILWSAVAAVAWAAFRGAGQWSVRIFSTAAITVAAVAFSHWFLDCLVHPAELPIAPGGPTLGLGLWDRQPLELEIELAIAGVGLLLYLVAEGIRGARGLAVIVLMVLMSAMTAWGVYAPDPPPSIGMLAYLALVTIGVVIAVGAWADASPRGSAP